MMYAYIHTSYIHEYTHTCVYCHANNDFIILLEEEIDKCGPSVLLVGMLEKLWCMCAYGLSIYHWCKWGLKKA